MDKIDLIIKDAKASFNIDNLKVSDKTINKVKEKYNNKVKVKIKEVKNNG